jgi:hypothetical protein
VYGIGEKRKVTLLKKKVGEKLEGLLVEIAEGEL